MMEISLLEKPSSFSRLTTSSALASPSGVQKIILGINPPAAVGAVWLCHVKLAQEDKMRCEPNGECAFSPRLSSLDCGRTRTRVADGFGYNPTMSKARA